jgi:hypothetical protein
LVGLVFAVGSGCQRFWWLCGVVLIVVGLGDFGGGMPPTRC